MDRETVERVAKTAHLALSEDELDRYSRDLGEILDYFRILDESPEGDGFGVDPVEIADVMREDVPGIFIDPYELLKDMKTYDNYVRGPKLL
ncbi:MAG: Asp-tRNA(Asn)/Glu-tRNA(Gln) amidotransferase GatCAB subunit C [Candidatus Methanoplasma sp.]|jgi:aspartyl-tRNA(Asn)/glutamyl-tRNA(Gln) amidotransferase subunit C|nr:Asp-tRNA(Asn)/Glu-tRNA(Gln) amidotransferase GatCAB subunit C [Candidatus Methanoplasma sp.]